MTNSDKILECVPNFSEGRDAAKIEKIVESFRNRKGVMLLDYQSDPDHNRMVVTVAGEPGALTQALLSSIATAVKLIDLNHHRGQHPRMGAVDVVPFIPVKNVSIDEAVALSKEVAREVADSLDLPVFLYEDSATDDSRRDLAVIRRGGFERMADKMKDPAFKPDYGPDTIHPTAGVVAIGARKPLVAFNVNLATDRFEVADRIAKKVRFRGGGLPCCKAMGVRLEAKGMVQVSMNLTDYSTTGMHQVFELISSEAEKDGVGVVGSEIIGLVPMAALVESALSFLKAEEFSMDQVLETRFM